MVKEETELGMGERTDSEEAERGPKKTWLDRWGGQDRLIFGGLLPKEFGLGVVTLGC